MKHMQSLIAHYSVILANILFLQKAAAHYIAFKSVALIIIQENSPGSLKFVKKPEVPIFAVFSTF